VENIHEIEK